ncbi:MAG: hypothetical protein A2W03_18170 [Candidatus Aminicenantes bacterium RBG_16_63_16]|nr:MAG: hypothetical protein A2W03_18170 [Candidatus Aminicenantes bacterium RBG_16_63_16]
MKTSVRARFSCFFLALLLAVLFSSPSAFSQPAGTDIVIGKRITVPSKVLNAEMTISVYLPENYLF